MKAVIVLLQVVLIFPLLILFSGAILMSCNRPSATAKKNNKDRTIKASKVSPNEVKKTLFLTFDDGPGTGTNNVSQTVEYEKILVTFFIIGNHVFNSRKQRQTWAALKADPYIELCNHGYTHAWHNNFNKFYLCPDSVVTDFKLTEDSLDFTNNIARMPGRNIWRTGTVKKTDIQNSVAAADSLRKAGFILIGWDFEWSLNPKSLNVAITADTLIKKLDSLFEHNKTRKAGNLVLLAHDRIFKNSYNFLQLRRLIEKLKNRKDYRLSWLSDYPN
ncbi:polysaccharide deacetylase family protein [Segetibacter koreensis]|uniref:polysaccharide deacetylase family protein n=1 Tax=Segetibacter koreensis TaxID=398037 RepID=UPI0003774630|nr:polysaccharide deacetylase family protein [Segetibacter koreensis]